MGCGDSENVTKIYSRVNGKLYFLDGSIELLLKLKSSIENARIIAASAERELQ